MVQVSVPTPELALSEQPRTQIDSAAFNRPMKVSIGSGLEQLGSGAEDLATDLAKSQAQSDLAKGVTLDANGTPQVANPSNSLILGRAGQAYSDALVQGTKSEMSAGVSNDLTAIRQQNPTDPQAFLAAANTYAESRRQAYPGDVGNALATQAHNEAAQHFANMTEVGARRDVQMSEQAIQTDISDTMNKMTVLARQQATGTPDYNHLQDKLQDGYQSLANNPLYGYSQEKIDSLTDNALSQLKGEQVVGAVDATFTRKGGDGGRAGAQAMLEREVLNNPDLNLSDQERKQLYSAGMAHLQYLTSEQKAQIDANRPAVNDTIEVLRKNPSSLSEMDYGRIRDQAASIGDAEGVMRLEAARANSIQAKPLAGLSPEQQFNAMSSNGASGSEKQALDFFVSKGWTPAQASGIVGNLVRESGLRTGALNKGDGADGSDSIGLGQWNSTRAAQLKQFAAQQGRSPYDFQTQLAFTQHELETSEGNAATMLRAAQTPQDAAAAFALGYERPAGFMTGDITKVSGGNDRVANAVRLAGGGASTSLVASGPSANGVPFTPDQVKANPFLMSEYVHSIATNDKNINRLGETIGAAIETQIKSGNTPNAETVGNFLQLAHNDPEKFGAQAERIQQSLGGQSLGSVAAGMPGQTGQSVLDQAKALSQGGSLYQLNVAEEAQKSYARQQDALKQTPFTEAARRGWITREPTPIDFSSPQGQQALPQAMMERSNAANVIASMTGQKQLPLAPDDLKQLSGGMAGMPVAGVSATLGAISSMPAPQVDALMANGEFKQTVLGLTRSGDPAKMNAAFSFLDQQYRRNPLAFDADDSGALKSLRAWQALGQYLPPDQVAKKMMAYNDPGEMKARDILEKKADEDLKSLDPSTILKQLPDARFGSNVPLVGGLVAAGGIASDRPAVAMGVVSNDFTQAYKDLYAETGDADASKKYAMEKVANKYSVSTLNGGRVMAYAPDRENADGTGAYYPKINNSFDWFHDQLRHEIQQTPFFNDLRLQNHVEANRVARGLDVYLMPDEQTQADISARRAPSYKVLAQGDDGRLHLVQGQGNQPFRFFGDPADYQAKAAAAFTAHRSNATAVDASPYDAPMGGE